MRIKSRAGNFNMTIEDVAVEDGELVMTGKMGVWSAKTMLSVDELREMLGTMKVSAKVVDFAALFAFRYLVGLVEEDRRRRLAPAAQPAAPAPAPKPQ
ncbi:hypothetical protein [Candidatus Binatus soli]|jgi:hypothetical protein|uniref:hypothetical protein n=1 Tax=Candidatus Binatus soli TaxID=1953413 RepID=UPI003D0AD953